MRRRILRIDVAGGGLGSASGTASAVLHGRPGEVQAALYTGAKPVSGHYCEFPDEMSNLYRSFNRPSGIKFSVFRRIVSHEQGCSRVKVIRHKEKKKKILSRPTSSSDVRRDFPKTKTVYLTRGTSTLIRVEIIFRGIRRFRERDYGSSMGFSNSCENDKVQQLNSWWKHTNCNPALNDTNVATVLRIRCAQENRATLIPYVPLT